MFFTLPMMYKNECLGMKDGRNVQYEYQHEKCRVFLFLQGGGITVESVDDVDCGGTAG
jgi:hypothetical protein